MAGPSPANNSRPTMDHRRMSTPGGTVQPGTSPSIKTEGATTDADYMRQTQSATLPMGQYSPWQDMGPFTTTLPPESQQMLGPVLDTSDPFQAQLMQGSDGYTNMSGYPWADMSQGIKGMPVHPSAWAGMSATLAPSALVSTSTSGATTPATSAHPPKDSTAPSNGIDFNFSQESKGLNLHNLDPTTNDHLDSGQETPSEGFWDNFVHDASWSEDTSTAI
jgi:hypothetical protein